MKTDRLLVLITVAQLILGVRVLARFVRGSIGVQRVEAVPAGLAPCEGCVSVVVPVLDEDGRLGPCLDGLTAQGPEVGEILVVDGGSQDGTQELVEAYRRRDRRVRLIDASPVPAGWNGKAWGLQVGLTRGEPATEWVLTVDADVRPASGLVRTLLAHARRVGVPALSVATRQELGGLGEALLHPAMLTTVVYRLGPPGHATRRAYQVQANGQCFLARRAALRETDAFAVARASRCEDMTVARCLAVAGHAVGFYEAGDLVSAHMYEGWRETWRNWPRSLPLHDQFSGVTGIIGLCEVTLAQALPLPLILALGLRALSRPPTARRRSWSITATASGVSGILALARCGVLVGTARAYRHAPWSYWLSPLCDAPVALALWRSRLRRRHVWRGRVLVDGEST